jgi:hypothetical protein
LKCFTTRLDGIQPLVILGDFLNLVLAGLRLGLKNRQVDEKWVSDDCSYLCENFFNTLKTELISQQTYQNQRTS